MSSSTATREKVHADLMPQLVPDAPANALTECRRPFPVVKWKPGKVSGQRALAMAYIDARDVQDRLDHVFGMDWSDHYREVPGGVECSILIRNTTRADVGEPGDGPMGKGPKAMYSDALKRAAVQFGIGRYLYDLPSVWVAYDPERKALTDAGKKELRNRYAAWLENNATIEHYGPPLSHSLMVEQDEPDSDPTSSAPAVIPPAPQVTPDLPPVAAGAAPSETTPQQHLLRALRDRYDLVEDRKAFCTTQGVEYRQTAILDLSDVRATEIINALRVAK